jgi:hypothetical protein
MITHTQTYGPALERIKPRPLAGRLSTITMSQSGPIMRKKTDFDFLGLT